MGKVKDVKDISGPSQNHITTLNVELQQTKIRLEMHRIALQQSQQIKALEEQVMTATTQHAALQELVKSLKTKIQEQIDSNSGMAHTFKAQNVMQKVVGDDRLRILSGSFVKIEEFRWSRDRITTLEEARSALTGKIDIIFSRLEERGNRLNDLYEAHKKHKSELEEFSNRLTGVERRISQYYYRRQFGSHSASDARTSNPADYSRASGTH